MVTFHTASVSFHLTDPLSALTTGPIPPLNIDRAQFNRLHALHLPNQQQQLSEILTEKPRYIQYICNIMYVYIW